MTRSEYRWLLPSALAGAEPAADRERPRRTLRDWIVDITAFLIALGIGVLALDAIKNQAGYTDLDSAADQVLGVLSCCTLWVRRRWPVGLAAVLVVVSAFAPLSAGAVLVALFSLAVHRPFRPVLVLGAGAVAAGGVQAALRPDPTMSWISSTLFGTVLVLLVIIWGLFVRSRRQLVVVLRERAHRAEAEADLRAEQAQRLAREAIAREMHDVLAHRLTLLSVHAGALEFRPGAPAPEVARAAGVIRDSAHEALQDLREIIGVLRTPARARRTGRSPPWSHSKPWPPSPGRPGCRSPCTTRSRTRPPCPPRPAVPPTASSRKGSPTPVNTRRGPRSPSRSPAAPGPG